MAHKFFLLVVSLGMLHGPSCGADNPGNGPNGPCERTSDCLDGLTCLQGLCASPDAGAPSTRVMDAGAPDGNDTD